MIWGKTEEGKNSKRSKAFSYNPDSIVIQQYVQFLYWNISLGSDTFKMYASNDLFQSEY